MNKHDFSEGDLLVDKHTGERYLITSDSFYKGTLISHNGKDYIPVRDLTSNIKKKGGCTVAIAISTIYEEYKVIRNLKRILKEL